MRVPRPSTFFHNFLLTELKPSKGYVFQGQGQTVGHLKLQRLYLNSAGAAAYVLWPSGAQRLLFQYERYGVALADAFINQIHNWSAWQLVPANAVQMNVAPLYGLPTPVHSDSLIAREKHPSAPPQQSVSFL
jgi:glycosyl transferase family 25